MCVNVVVGEEEESEKDGREQATINMPESALRLPPPKGVSQRLRLCTD